MDEWCRNSTTTWVGSFRMFLAFRTTIFSKGFFFGDIRIQVNKWGNQNVGGIHDLVAHDDLSKGHAVQLLLGVWFH